MNRALAERILKELLSAGVREFCVCPGARNSPWVALLTGQTLLHCWWHYEERSAAFFALGRIKSTGRPVAVITTSGTAAAELLPATMEAHYTNLPLVLLTADRPRRFRGTGAPQTAEQVGIYGVYVEDSVDLAEAEVPDLAGWSRARPIHVNACFEEPLLDAPAEPAPGPFPSRHVRNTEPGPSREKLRAIEDFLSAFEHPLILVSSLRADDREAVAEFLDRLNAPAYLEAPSGLREDGRLLRIRLRCGDRILERASRQGYPVDAILRIGGVPTLRLWRDLEDLGGRVPVLSIGREALSGLSWAQVIAGPIGRILPELRFEPRDFSRAGRLLDEERRLGLRIEELLSGEPRSEPSLIGALSRAIPSGSRIFLGNSLPIREWDLAATGESRSLEIGASRGLNGIDGQVSTFLGFTDPAVDNWAILGDLTALYDLAGPWIVPQLPARTRLTLAVINNSGGKIFERMFPQREFRNAHSTEFSGWARLWNLAYERWENVPGSPGTRERGIVEIRPDDAATARFWESYDGLCKMD